MLRYLTISFLALPLAAQSHQSAVRSYVASHEAAIVAELRDLLAIPNVAATMAGARNGFSTRAVTASPVLIWSSRIR